MSGYQQTASTHENQLMQGSNCDHCGGTTTHERWCISCNTLVRYAYGIVLDGRHLTLGDAIILHALGVDWSGGRL